MTREKQIILGARIVSLVFTPFYLPLVGLLALFLLSYLSLYCCPPSSSDCTVAIRDGPSLNWDRRSAA